MRPEILCEDRAPVVHRAPTTPEGVPVLRALHAGPDGAAAPPCPPADASAERRARPVPAPAGGAERMLFARAAERRTEARAAAALLALWVGLWAVFTLGVLAPATAVHAAREAAAPAAAEAPSP